MSSRARDRRRSPAIVGRPRTVPSSATNCSKTSSALSRGPPNGLDRVLVRLPPSLRRPSRDRGGTGPRARPGRASGEPASTRRRERDRPSRARQARADTGRSAPHGARGSAGSCSTPGGREIRREGSEFDRRGSRPCTSRDAAGPAARGAARMEGRGVRAGSVPSVRSKTPGGRRARARPPRRDCTAATPEADIVGA